MSSSQTYSDFTDDVSLRAIEKIARSGKINSDRMADRFDKDSQKYLSSVLSDDFFQKSLDCEVSLELQDMYESELRVYAIGFDYESHDEDSSVSLMRNFIRQEYVKAHRDFEDRSQSLTNFIESREFSSLKEDFDKSVHDNDVREIDLLPNYHAFAIMDIMAGDHDLAHQILDMSEADLAQNLSDRYANRVYDENMYLDLAKNHPEQMMSSSLSFQSEMESRMRLVDKSLAEISPGNAFLDRLADQAMSFQNSLPRNDQSRSVIPPGYKNSWSLNQARALDQSKPGLLSRMDRSAAGRFANRTLFSGRQKSWNIERSRRLSEIQFGRRSSAHINAEGIGRSHLLQSVRKSVSTPYLNNYEPRRSALLAEKRQIQFAARVSKLAKDNPIAALIHKLPSDAALLAAAQIHNEAMRLERVREMERDKERQREDDKKKEREVSR